MLYGELPEVKWEGADAPVRGFRFTVANPPKVAILRLPTSPEMIERMDSQKSIRRTLGRRKSQTEPVANPKADLDLFAKIRVAGDDFDEFEARNAIVKLTAVDLVDCERQGDSYCVTLKTPFCETIHHVAIPTAKQLNEYRRSVVKSTELPHSQEELRYRTQSAIDLYDVVIQKAEGYAEGISAKDVPAHHKFAVAGELASAVEDLDPVFDPNF